MLHVCWLYACWRNMNQYTALNYTSLHYTTLHYSTHTHTNTHIYTYMNTTKIVTNSQERFDKELIIFKGIDVKALGKKSKWDHKGWTGSRGDICRSLIREIREKYTKQVQLLFETRLEVVDVYTGEVKITKIQPGLIAEEDDENLSSVENYELVIGCDGAGSSMRGAFAEVIPGFEVTKYQNDNYCKMLHFDNLEVVKELDPCWLQVISVVYIYMFGARMYFTFEFFYFFLLK